MTIKEYLLIPSTFVAIKEAFIFALSKVYQGDDPTIESSVTSVASLLTQHLVTGMIVKMGNREIIDITPDAIETTVALYTPPPFNLLDLKYYTSVKKTLKIDSVSITDPTTNESYKSYPQTVTGDSTGRESIDSKTGTVTMSAIKTTNNDTHTDSELRLTPQDVEEMERVLYKSLDDLVNRCCKSSRKSATYYNGDE